MLKMDEIGTEDGEANVSEWKKLFVCEALVSALEKKGFKTPTPIQRLTLPAAIKVKLSSECEIEVLRPIPRNYVLRARWI